MVWNKEQKLLQKWIQEDKRNPDVWWVRRNFPPFVIERFKIGDGTIALTRRGTNIVSGIWRSKYGF
jgi:hypothetical protein